jgi:sulfate transport system permease protein
MAQAQVISRVGDNPATRRILIGVGGLMAVVFLGLPVVLIFTQAFSLGVSVYLAKISTPDTLHAVYLSLLTTFLVVPVNTFFGICAAWAVTRFSFPGKRLLTALIEIPFSISPIVAGLACLFLYGSQGLLGPWLADHDIRLMFSVTAIFLASLFVTSPFVARELITLMQSQGSEDEEAALSLGASGLETFLRITLPNIKWALLYGVILCNARVLGEFGAVSVVSGKIRGETNTLPLQIELLFHDYNAVGAFAASSILTFVALLTLIAKAWMARREGAGIRSLAH